MQDIDYSDSPTKLNPNTLKGSKIAKEPTFFSQHLEKEELPRFNVNGNKLEYDGESIIGDGVS